ncbi:MAG: hypothetical protein GTN80_03070 [Nitrososphaeria archaeon]|nr:hypothetical protein [Nitrososphaeria archaeon]NIN52161.1 hypothetical protein [Nitrososphaeria archaeon]NIQ32614.1 hypothetical protein [Nitrososphaeria archaeon]
MKSESTSNDESIESVCTTIRSLLKEAVKRNLTEGILLSGGLDTSILAALTSNYAHLKAFTVALDEAPAPDIEYATLMARHLRLEHIIHVINTVEMHYALREVIETMQSFDPVEVRNDLTVFIALKTAKENDVSSVMTGDGADELFAGYSFLYELKGEKLDQNLEKMWDVMRFSSLLLAENLGIDVRLPYLDHDFKAYAMALDSRLKVQTKDGKRWGKWILRKTFENELPKEVTWRIKTPIEHGSGTTTLPSFFCQKTTDKEFEEKKQRYLEDDGVTIRDKEHLYYYEIYRSTFGRPRPSDPEARICPQCNSNVPKKTSFCRTCGAYPI